MYLTRRQNGFRFQRGIPKNLEPILGKSPIRIHIGNLPACDSSRIARLLASNSDLFFQKVSLEGCRTLPDNTDDPNDPKDPDYTKSMDALVSELERLAIIEDMKTTKHLLDVLRDKTETQTLTPAGRTIGSSFQPYSNMSVIRRLFYTGNAIGGLHKDVRKYTKSKGAFTS